MNRRNRYARDALGGAVIIAIGLFMIGYATTYFEVGTLTRMESGMMPTLLGGVLVALGVMISLPAVIVAARRSSPPGVVVEPVAWRACTFVILSIAVFASSISRLGMVPTLFILTMVASFADGGINIRRTLSMGVLVTLLVVLVFKYGLGVTTPLFMVPW